MTKAIYITYAAFLAYVGIDAGVDMAVAWLVTTGIFPLMIYGSAE